MSWMTWLLIAILGSSTEQTLHRRLLLTAGRPWDYLVGYNLGAIVFLMILSRPTIAGVNGETLSLLFLSGLFWFFACLLSFKADEHAEVTLTSILGQLQFVFLTLGGFIFFHEPVSGRGVLGIILIAFGLLIRIPFASSLSGEFNPGISLKAVSILSASAAILLDKKLSAQIDAGSIALFGFGIPLLIGLFIRRRYLTAVIDLMRELRFANVGLGALGCLWYYSLIRAITDAPLSTVFPLYQLHLLVTLAFGFLFLREIEQPKQKLAAAALVTLGTMVLRW